MGTIILTFWLSLTTPYCDSPTCNCFYSLFSLYILYSACMPPSPAVTTVTPIKQQPWNNIITGWNLQYPQKCSSIVQYIHYKYYCFKIVTMKTAPLNTVSSELRCIVVYISIEWVTGKHYSGRFPVQVFTCHILWSAYFSFIRYCYNLSIIT